MKNSVLEFFSWYSGACGVGGRGTGPPSGARISSRGPLRPWGSRGLWAPAPCMQEDPSLLLSLVSPGPSSAWALLRKCCPISCPVINMYKSLDSLGHQAWAELGCLSPRLQHGNSLGAGVLLPTPIPPVTSSQAAASWPRTRRNCWVLWPNSLTLSTMSWAAAGDGYCRAAALVVATMPRRRSHSRLL